MTGTGAPDVLDRTACLRLLESTAVGRVAWAGDGGRVVVLPVNFVLDGDTIVFHSGPGAKLTAARDEPVLTFEVDETEPALRTGWSVLVHGRAKILDDPAEIAALNDRSGTPWLDLSGASLVRIVADEVSGRRLPLHAGEISVERQGPWRAPSTD